MRRGYSSHPLPHASRERFPVCAEDGLATLMALIAISVFSMVGVYMVLNATTEVRISDNYESEVQAGCAARAGLNHTREVLRGVPFDGLLRGPDGAFNSSTAYVAQARTFAFRNPISWATARSLNIFDPSADVASLPDDGLVNGGKYGTSNGYVLIPSTGVAQTAANPYGSGTVTTARYFVKVTDNNGEATETAKDSVDSPFHDGDGIIIVRSVGVAQTLREGTGGAIRRNSVAVVESRFKRRNTFNLDAPLVVEGSNVLPSSPNMFDGNAFRIDGGAGNPGIATIDTDAGDGISPTQAISSQLASNQHNNIRGTGGSPSISDLTGTVGSDPDKALLLDQNYLYNFATSVVPQFADNVYNTSQSWSGGSAPDIGTYDITKPATDPTQNPKVTYVNGDLSVSGNMWGAGLLVVRGRLSGSGRFEFNGLILVIGAGDVDLSGLNVGINGGMYIVNVTESGGVISFGTPRFTMAGNSNITIDSDAIAMGVGLIPPVQMGWREVNSMMDP